MKTLKLTLAAALLATTFQVNAAEQETGLTCYDLASLAESIMSARQAGVKLSDLLQVDEGVPGFKTLTIDAYKSTRYETKSIQQDMISEFSNKYMIMCLEHNEGK